MLDTTAMLIYISVILFGLIGAVIIVLAVIDLFSLILGLKLFFTELKP